VRVAVYIIFLLFFLEELNTL